MESFSEAALCSPDVVCPCLFNSMHVFEPRAPACLPNCFSVVSFVFLCVVVSHLRPHQLILALCNVNCVRTNDLFWVLFFKTLFIQGSNYLFNWLKSGLA